MPTADNLRSIELYRRTAAGYDASTGPTWPIRMRCIEHLALRPGETVLDVGCGTGLSFEALLQGVGRSGRLVAFEQSPEMHAQARQRADALRADGWSVELLPRPGGGLIARLVLPAPDQPPSTAS
jgi:demethylmenaquinone methyltransferase/2-methoxy-6-polyprenyl-1,4-benzoquinol methylase